ncbi:MAG: helix-hairpin-helix domain-containing protein [Candidatus Riflebacteria bacterium]|nr:helix-hairpin-helix domain-containing protein [Candidatus Riflebacteria bacterium]
MSEKEAETKILIIENLTPKKVAQKGPQLATEAKMININSSDEKQLMELKIGQKLAEKIIEMREKVGAFHDISELLFIKGITKKKLEKIMERGGIYKVDKEKRFEKMDLNFASEAEIETLPGIGKKLATLIIEFRKEKGKIRKLDDLLEISGITENLLGKISDLVEVR